MRQYKIEDLVKEKEAELTKLKNEHFKERNFLEDQNKALKDKIAFFNRN